MAKAKKPSLAELAKSMPTGRRVKTWFDHLDPDVAGAISELRDNYRKGEYAGQTVSALWRFVRNNTSVTIGLKAFEDWLQK